MVLGSFKSCIQTFLFLKWETAEAKNFPFFISNAVFEFQPDWQEWAIDKKSF